MPILAPDGYFDLPVLTVQKKAWTLSRAFAGHAAVDRYGWRSPGVLFSGLSGCGRSQKLISGARLGVGWLGAVDE